MGRVYRSCAIMSLYGDLPDVKNKNRGEKAGEPKLEEVRRNTRIQGGRRKTSANHHPNLTITLSLCSNERTNSRAVGNGSEVGREDEPGSG